MAICAAVRPSGSPIPRARPSVRQPEAPLGGAASRTRGFAVRPSASLTASGRVWTRPLRIPPVVSEGELLGRQPAIDVSARTVSDGELIERAGRGDRSALETLYERYARSVFGLALRRLGDRGRAEDAVQ